MDLYAKGQLSFLILTCLLERDFYGLDLISEIYNKSNGRIELKKPSVYSNLTRMEKQGYVSSYLKSSDLGPNRKYYSITERGRSFYQDLKDYFERNNIDVFRDFKDFEAINNTINVKETNAVYNNINYFSQKQDNFNTAVQNDNSFNTNEIVEENSNEEDNDYFDFSSLDNNTSTDVIEEQEHNHYTQTVQDNYKEENVTEINEEVNTHSENVQTNTYSIKSLLNTTDIYSSDKNDFVNKVVSADNNLQQTETEVNNENREEITEDTKKDDAVFLNTKDVEEYNKRLYDISKDINKFKRKKSFAEDQIAFQVDNSSPISEANERTKSNIEDFKNSILENKGKTGSYDYSKQMAYRFNKENKSYQNVLKSNNKETKDEHKQDDGKFITSRLDASQIERAKKIEPARLKIVTETSSSRDSYSMPAPKRDKSIDPSHKEILSRLYSKTKTSSNDEIREDALYDYNDLKDFYKEQNISFNEYQKPAEKTEHNTNKLYLIVSLVTFLVSSIISAILYGILAGTNLLNNATSFLYILLPALLLIDIAVAFYNYKKYKSWMPNPMWQQWKVWGLAFLISAIVVGLNFICGMSPARFAEFATTTILPIILAFIIFPLRYYVKRFLLIKYWR